MFTTYKKSSKSLQGQEPKMELFGRIVWISITIWFVHSFILQTNCAIIRLNIVTRNNLTEFDRLIVNGELNQTLLNQLSMDKNVEFELIVDNVKNTNSTIDLYNATFEIRKPRLTKLNCSYTNSSIECAPFRRYIHKEVEDALATIAISLIIIIFLLVCCLEYGHRQRKRLQTSEMVIDYESFDSRLRRQAFLHSLNQNSSTRTVRMTVSNSRPGTYRIRNMSLTSSTYANEPADLNSYGVTAGPSLLDRERYYQNWILNSTTRPMMRTIEIMNHRNNQTPQGNRL